MTCDYCQRELNWPCRNSRDMTDAAIEGSDICFEALERNGWGESGERYVRLNREKIARERETRRAAKAQN